MNLTLLCIITSHEDPRGTQLTPLSMSNNCRPSTVAAVSSPPRRGSPTSDNPSSTVVIVDISSHQASSQPHPLSKNSLWLQKIDIYQSISVEKNSIQPVELLEIHKATRVLLETLIRGSRTDFNPEECLTQPVTFNSSGQPGIRQWCEHPESKVLIYCFEAAHISPINDLCCTSDRELFTPSLEVLWYQPNNFDFDTIAKSDPPDSIPRHERFLWNTLKNFSMPSATFIERGMHYVLAALVLIGSDAEPPQVPHTLPDVTPISRGLGLPFHAGTTTNNYHLSGGQKSAQRRLKRLLMGALKTSTN